MATNFLQEAKQSFLGDSPDWYKYTILLFLLVNPIVYFISPLAAGWLLLAEFIFTLAMALKCYPLLPGGLLALEAVFLGMASTDKVYQEVAHNFPVLLLLMFMVAGIYFMKDMLLLVFSKLLLSIKSKTLLALIFCFTSAFLSAFLDALTVTAVIIAIAVGFYKVYHQVASGVSPDDETHNLADDTKLAAASEKDLEEFRAFLRSLLMHAAIGTALGGVSTMVGEPQNLIIAKEAGWDFVGFFVHMAPVSMPVLVAGLFTCFLLEVIKPFGKLFGYEGQLPPAVKQILANFFAEETAKSTAKDKAALVMQIIAGLFLVLALALHLAEVGLIGLAVIIFLTSMNGVTDEGSIGKSFEEAMPFTALLVVFFAVVAVIQELNMFGPFMEWVIAKPAEDQASYLYLVNGLLSAISDNVFVATIYIGEIKKAFVEGLMSREQFEHLALAINTGTNLPSVATPNGQAAFLFLLTSAIAPLIRLSYGRMVLMAIPYALVMGLLGFWATTHWA